VNCPFCHTENRVSNDSDVVVCFKCYDSFSIIKDKFINNKGKNHNYYKYTVDHNSQIIHNDLAKKEIYIQNQINQNNLMLKNMTKNINYMIDSYLINSKDYINENLNKYTNQIINPLRNNYEPFLKENLELMKKINENFERFKSFENIYLNNNFKPDKINYLEKIYNNKNIRDKNYQFDGNGFIGDLDFNPISDNNKRIRSSNVKDNNKLCDELTNDFNSSLKSDDYDNFSRNLNKNDTINEEITNRDFYNRDNKNDNRGNIFDLNKRKNNYNYPKIFSFDENGKLVKNVI